MKTPILEAIDISLAREHECPGINNADYFLALIGDEYYFGKFSRQWYGLFFVCGYGVSGGMQFDAPGSNSSRWQGLWRLVSE